MYRRPARPSSSAAAPFPPRACCCALGHAAISVEPSTPASIATPTITVTGFSPARDRCGPFPPPPNRHGRALPLPLPPITHARNADRITADFTALPPPPPACLCTAAPGHPETVARHRRPAPSLRTKRPHRCCRPPTTPVAVFYCLLPAEHSDTFAAASHLTLNRLIPHRRALILNASHPLRTRKRNRPRFPSRCRPSVPYRPKTPAGPDLPEPLLLPPPPSTPSTTSARHHHRPYPYRTITTCAGSLPTLSRRG